MGKKQDKNDPKRNKKRPEDSNKKLKTASKPHPDKIKLNGVVTTDVPENSNVVTVTPNEDCTYSLVQIFDHLDNVVATNKKFSGVKVSRSTEKNCVSIDFSMCLTQYDDKKEIVETCFLESDKEKYKTIAILSGYYTSNIDVKSKNATITLTDACPYTAIEITRDVRMRMLRRKKYEGITIKETKNSNEVEFWFAQNKKYTKKQCEELINNILVNPNRSKEKIQLKTSHYEIDIINDKKAQVSLKNCPYTTLQVIKSLIYKTKHDGEFARFTVSGTSEVVIETSKSYDGDVLKELIKNLIESDKKENKEIHLWEEYFAQTFANNCLILKVDDSCPYLYDEVAEYIKRRIEYWSVYKGIKFSALSREQKITLDFAKCEQDIDENTFLSKLISKERDSDDRIKLKINDFDFSEMGDSVIITPKNHCLTIIRVAAILKPKLLAEIKYKGVTLTSSTKENKITFAFPNGYVGKLEAVRVLIEKEKKRKTIELESNYIQTKEKGNTLILTPTTTCPYTREEIRNYLRQRTLRSKTESYRGMKLNQGGKNQLIITFESDEDKNHLLPKILKLINKTHEENLENQNDTNTPTKKQTTKRKATPVATSTAEFATDQDENNNNVEVEQLNKKMSTDTGKKLRNSTQNRNGFFEGNNECYPGSANIIDLPPPATNFKI